MNLFLAEMEHKLQLQSKKYMGAVGLEPTLPKWETDFKSVASTIPPRPLIELG
jgi:hypothetical protein